ncbi:MAG: hypothetical protein ACT4P5_05960 [Armatimonadota bacterium]
MPARIAFFVAALALSLPAALRAAPADPRFLIVPGRSLGSLQLGTPIRAVIATWGASDRSGQVAPNLIMHAYPKYSIEVGATKDGTIIYASTTSDTYITSRGARVGSPVQPLVAAYGSRCDLKERALWCAEIGLVAWIREGVVAALGVFDPKVLGDALRATNPAALPTASGTADDRLIVPGLRIGKWTLSMTVEGIVASISHPPGKAGILDVKPGRDVREGVVALTWEHMRFGVGTNDFRTAQGARPADLSVTGKVAYLFVYSPAYRTEKDVGPGSSPRAVAAAYGPPTATNEFGDGNARLIYDQHGMAFSVGAGVVRQMFVFRAKGAWSIWNF